MNNLKNLITRTSAYNKIRIPFTNTYLIQWLPSSRTDIHNHLGEKCDFVPLYGSLHEVRFHQKNIGSLYESKKRNVFEKVHYNLYIYFIWWKLILAHIVKSLQMILV